MHTAAPTPTPSQDEQTDDHGRCNDRGDKSEVGTRQQTRPRVGPLRLMQASFCRFLGEGHNRLHSVSPWRLLFVGFVLNVPREF